jgi:tRNA threonylcarbamoyladenosine biosynthesis protein TsaE
MSKVAESKSEPLSREYESKSSAGTIAIGRKLAELLTPPRLLILRGDLGAGKTTLVKGIAAALGAADPEEVTSPTFTLVHEYAGALDGHPVKLLHLDLYRLDAERQLESLGLDEMRTPDAIILVEWGEKFKSIRKHADGEIVVTSTGGDARKIAVTLNSVQRS